MTAISWITDSQDEQSLEELLRDADQLQVPVFQRRYVWKAAQFEQLIQDLDQIKEEIEKSQFLGAIIAYEKPRPPEVVGRLRVLDIVDGQQRLLTLYVFVMAIVEHSVRYDKDMAIEIVQEFLLLSPRRGLEVNTRIVPSFDDRNQFRVIWGRLTSLEPLEASFRENPPTLPPTSGEEQGALLTQYLRIYRHIGNLITDTEPAALLRELLNLISQRLTFVHLVLKDPASAMKIFERLNFRGVKVGIADLVRNEIFSRMSNDPSGAARLYHQEWKPFETAFEGQAERFFFPYGLIHNENLKKSDLFAGLRSIWGDRKPNEILSHVVPYQRPFMAVEQGRHTPYESDVELRLDRLARLKRPSATYPFSIKILLEVTEERLSSSDAIPLFELLESFLVRRAIVGFEPTGLHALFKGLWKEISDEPTVNRLRSEILRRPTIQWPNDEEIEHAVRVRPLGKSKICPYLLVEFDKELPGDDPSDSPTIEHILPQTLSTDWERDFTRAQHKALTHTWANLIPLSAPLNESLQQAPFNRKRERYDAESMYATPRLVARTWSVWNSDSIADRAHTLAKWANKRWPYGP